MEQVSGLGHFGGLGGIQLGAVLKAGPLICYSAASAAVPRIGKSAAKEVGSSVQVRGWNRPLGLDAILTETCHHMHDGSYGAGGRNGQESFAEGR